MSDVKFTPKISIHSLVKRETLNELRLAEFAIISIHSLVKRETLQCRRYITPAA